MSKECPDDRTKLSDHLNMVSGMKREEKIIDQSDTVYYSVTPDAMVSASIWTVSRGTGQLRQIGGKWGSDWIDFSVHVLFELSAKQNGRGCGWRCS